MQDQLMTLLFSIGGTIVAATIALAGLILVQSRAVRRDMVQLESRLESRMDRMETRLGQHTAQVRDDLKRLDERVARLEHSQAKLEGLLEGLREAITRRNVA